MRNAGGSGFWGALTRWLIKVQLKYYSSQYSEYITLEEKWLQIQYVTIDFSKVPNLDVAESMDDGQKNTSEMYNFNGVSDVTGLMGQLENWGRIPDKDLSLSNPGEYAARMCVMKNKFNKELISSEDGNEAYKPVLKDENLVWYLPARNEAPNMQDGTYPLSGTYWTSTASDVENDNENAYKYTVGGSAGLNIRTDKFHVRAVRKRP